MNPILTIGNISLEQELYVFVGILFVLLVLCFILLTIIGIKYKKLEKANGNENDIEIVKDVIRKLIQKQKELDQIVKSTKQEKEELTKKVEELRDIIKKNEDELLLMDKKQRKCFDKIKVVRYSVNPSDEESLDYAIGITNNEDCGIVLTGVKQEDGGTKLEVKTIKNGVSKTSLSEEEKCAIDRIANIN